MPKKEFDKKIKERFKILKNKSINRINSSALTCTIELLDISEIKKKENNVFMCKSLGHYYAVGTKPNCLIVKKSLIKELFGIKEDIGSIDLKYKQGNRICFADVDDALINEEGLYYLITIEEKYYELIGEIK